MDDRLLTIYKLYLYALQERKLYGDIYGDNEAIINRYEKELEKNNIKILSKNNNKNNSKKTSK